MSKIPKILIGVSMHDAEVDLILDITASDVANATARDPLNCAAARALKRQLKITSACVMRARTYVNLGSKSQPSWIRFLTPEPLAREIVAIDRNGRFEPGVFKLKAPTKSQRLGRWRSGSRGPKKRKTHNEPLHRHVTANIREI